MPQRRRRRQAGAPAAKRPNPGPAAATGCLAGAAMVLARPLQSEAMVSASAPARPEPAALVATTCMGRASMQSRTHGPHLPTGERATPLRQRMPRSEGPGRPRPRVSQSRRCRSLSRPQASSLRPFASSDGPAQPLARPRSRRLPPRPRRVWTSMGRASSPTPQSAPTPAASAAAKAPPGLRVSAARNRRPWPNHRPQRGREQCCQPCPMRRL
mmetsp:Transcript_18364/g.69521  ORF Transcript_18364/g.69521 Transcript_18364/m.69521 type:complete len:213 (-) Transcript_18364:2397-3035(-)